MKKILMVGCILSIILSACADVETVNNLATMRSMTMDDSNNVIEVIDMNELLGNAQNYSNYSVDKTVLEKEDGMSFVTFKIKDENNKEVQTIEYDTYFTKEWYTEYEENGGEIYGFTDVNLDGYSDFIGQINGAVVNQYYNIYVYDESIQEFVYESDFSKLSLPAIQTEKRLLLSTYFERGIPSFYLYSIGDDTLECMGMIEAEISEAGEVSYTEKMNSILLQDGTITYLAEEQIKQIETINDIDSVWGSTGFEIRLE